MRQFSFVCVKQDGGEEKPIQERLLNLGVVSLRCSLMGFDGEEAKQHKLQGTRTKKWKSFHCSSLVRLKSLVKPDVLKSKSDSYPNVTTLHSAASRCHSFSTLKNNLEQNLTSTRQKCMIKLNYCHHCNELKQRNVLQEENKSNDWKIWIFIYTRSLSV